MPKQQILTKNELISAAIAKANVETESLIAKYLAAHPDAKIEECQLVQRTMPDSTIRVWVEPIKRTEAFLAMQQALIMVRDADNDVKSDGGEGMPQLPRSTIDKALALAVQGS